jgi:hypothetical protein
LFAYTTLTLVSFYINARVSSRTIIFRWQRAALDLADLNLVKEGNKDLKKGRVGRKSSFPLGLLTSGNLSPVDSKEHAGFTSIGAIVRLFFLRFVAAENLTEFKRSAISTSVKNSNRSGYEFISPWNFLSTLRFFISSCATCRIVQNGECDLLLLRIQLFPSPYDFSLTGTHENEE